MHAATADAEVDQGRRKFLTVATAPPAQSGAVFTAVPVRGLAGSPPSAPAPRVRRSRSTCQQARAGPDGHAASGASSPSTSSTARRRCVGKLAGARRAAEGSGVRRNPSSRPTRKNEHALARATTSLVLDRHLHAPGLPAEAALRAGRCRAGRRLAGRLLLPLPWLALRSGRPRVRRLAGLDEPARSALQLSRTTTRCVIGVRMTARQGSRRDGRSDDGTASAPASGAGSTSACRSSSSCASQLLELLRAEELQHLVFLRLAGAAGAGDAAGDRHLPDHALQGRAKPPPSTRSNTSCARSTTAG